MTLTDSLDDRISKLEDVADKLGDPQAEREVSDLRRRYQRLKNEVDQIERKIEKIGRTL